MLRVVDTFSSPNPGEVMVAVEVLRGDPELGMTFSSPDADGRWLFSTPVQYIPDRSVTHDPPRRPICLRSLQGELSAIKPGVTLAEA